MKDYPPYLDKIHETYPLAAGMYTTFWRKKNEKNELILEKREIIDDLLLSWKTFNTNIRHLKRHDVIDFQSIYKGNPDLIKITFKVS